MSNLHRKPEDWQLQFWISMAAIAATAAITFWFAPIMSVFITLFALLATVAVVWLVVRAVVSLVGAIRGPRPVSAAGHGEDVDLMFEPPTLARRKAWLALFVLAAATAGLAYGTPFAGGPLDHLGFRAVYAAQARAFARRVLADPERYIKPVDDVEPTAIPRERVPARLRRLGRVSVVNPGPLSNFTVSEPCILFGSGGGFGHFGYIVGQDSLRVKDGFWLRIVKIAPGIYSYRDR
jgi:hypothetical protein